jgi:hypothetical protein
MDYIEIYETVLDQYGRKFFRGPRIVFPLDPRGKKTLLALSLIIANFFNF